MIRKKENTIDRVLAFAIEIILVVVVGFIILVSLMKPQNNLFSWQMCIGTLLSGIMLMCLYLIWTKITIKMRGGGMTFYLLLV